MSPFGEFFPSVVSVAVSSWFIWLPVLALFLFLETWHTYIRNLFKADLEWAFLEIKIPREIRRGPKAMEQVFSALHSFISGPSDIMDRYWKGEVKLWYSFEAVSFGGEVHFYIRIPKKHKNYLEANLYAQYPDIEIEEVDDYTLRMPHNYELLRKAGYELWGTELKLEKDDAYPIRLYEEFETPSEYSTLDPVSALIEVLSSLRPGEELWLQILAAPASGAWQEKGVKMAKKMMEKTRTVTEDASGKQVTADRSPGEELVIKAIERNVAKPGYQTTIRYVYLAPDAIYDKNIPWYGVLGAFNQYGSKALNSFKHDGAARTAVLWYYWPYFFPTWRGIYRRKGIFSAFRKRTMKESALLTILLTKETLAPSHMVLNTEELATVYHFPSNMVLTAPSIQRVESKKVGPPAGLPIYGSKSEEDTVLEGFKKK